MFINHKLSAPYLYHNVSPVLPFIAVVMSLMSISNLLKTSFSDPGIIPRATNLEVIHAERQQQSGISSNLLLKYKANLKKCTLIRIIRRMQCQALPAISSELGRNR